jgi:hypothetical protein
MDLGPATQNDGYENRRLNVALQGSWYNDKYQKKVNTRNMFLST